MAKVQVQVAGGSIQSKESATIECLAKLVGAEGYIAAVDSMAARRTVWEKIKKSLGVDFLIDPRMASEYALAYVMNPHDEKDRITYEKVLYSDEDSVQERCTAKATMYTATMISGYVAKMVKDVVTKGKYARVSHWDIGMNNLQNWSK